MADLEVVRLVRMNHPSQPRESNLIRYVLNVQSLDLQALELARLATTCKACSEYSATDVDVVSQLIYFLVCSVLYIETSMY